MLDFDGKVKSIIKITTEIIFELMKTPISILSIDIAHFLH